MPSLFGITPADLQAKLVPVAHEDEQSFTIGDDGDLSTAAAEEIIAAAEEIVLSRLPKRYRQLCRAVDGEILVARAVGGELTLATGLAPLVPGSLRLWKNFPDDRVWSILDQSLAMSGGYTVQDSTGAITLASPLGKGDRLWASYRHLAAPRLAGVRHVALSLAAVEVGRRTSFYNADGQDQERFSAWENAAYGDINRMASIDLLDQLELVREDGDPENYWRRAELLST